MELCTAKSKTVSENPSWVELYLAIVLCVVFLRKSIPLTALDGTQNISSSPYKVFAVAVDCTILSTYNSQKLRGFGFEIKTELCSLLGPESTKKLGDFTLRTV